MSERSELTPFANYYGRIKSMLIVVHVGLIPLLHNPVYCATKHGVVGFTKSMKEHSTSDRVRVNCICPTFVDTAMVRAGILEKPDSDETLRSYVLDNIIRCVEFQCHFT